jgi:BirA family biotin operon repressor/biotin-[acetyl-CoA-carboxylase] ligase
MAEGFRGGRLLRFEQVGSTMDVARNLEEPGPFTVVARSQTAGRGRFDRTWVSPPSGGLYLTASLPWTRPLSQAPLVSMGTALALARLACQIGCPRITLKWPNDLLLSDRKTAGILAEMHHTAPGASRLLVGVGLNVSIPEDALAQVGQPATSLAAASGRELEPEQVLEDFLRLWTEVDQTLETSGFPALVEEYRGFTDLQGRHFRLEGAGGSTSVVRVVSVREDGSLQVEHIATGVRQSLHGGELVSMER